MPKTISDKIEQWLLQHRRGTAMLKRPQVTLCYAQSWDGSITIRAGESLALSNDDSLRLTHLLRSLHDGILVGIGTVLADDPQLTVRECEGGNPQAIVLDSSARIPASARLCRRESQKCWVVISDNEPAIARNDIEPIRVARIDGSGLDLRQVLAVLWEKGIHSVMVEGGATVINAFVRAGLADAIVLTVAPTLVGGYKAIDNLGLSTSAQLPRISPISTHSLGDDLIMWGQLNYGSRND
jgi:riboflavin-specific deaminase-like protein